MNAPCELVSLGGLLLSVHSIEQITLQPLYPMSSMQDDDNDRHFLSASLRDMQLVEINDPAITDRWVEFCSVPNHHQGERS